MMTMILFSWLITQSNAIPIDNSSKEISAEMVRIAKQEHEFWNSRTETDPDVSIRLQQYWKAVRVNLSTDELQKPDVQNTYPWSSAFISWVVKQAGGKEQFDYSPAHWKYVSSAKKNRIDQNDNLFKAYRIDELKPRVGDIVVKWRNEKHQATYDNIDKPHQTHGDIVVEVKPDRLITIGGNVGNTVRITEVKLDEKGFINQPRYFAIVRTE